MMTGMIEILVYSLGISLLIAILYKVLINPTEARKAKSDMEYHKERIKKARKSGNTEEIN